MLKRLAVLGLLAPLTLGNLSSRADAAGWVPLAALMMGAHLSGSFETSPRHGGGYYRPPFDPRRYGGFYRDGGYRDGFYRDGFYRDGGYRAPYPPGYGYYSAADGGYDGCDRWGRYGNYGGYGGYVGYGGYGYDDYGW
jgi:hypothetical protein